MRKTGRCILSAVIAVLLMIGAIDYAFVIGIRGLIMDFIQSNTRNQQERAVLTRL